MTAAKQSITTPRNANASRFKKFLTSTAIAAAALALAVPGTARAVDADALPTGEHNVRGNVDFDRVLNDPDYAARLNITSLDDLASIDWESFDIGREAIVEIFQNNSDSWLVNRVTGAGTDPTQILGALLANGNVAVLDRNGVIFGKDSDVDVGGILASTGNIDLDKFHDEGVIELSDFGSGAIELRGQMNIADAGLAAFVSPFVKNSGIIQARMGRVEMAAGEKVTLDLYGDGLLELAVDGEVADALLENTGTIEAESGTVVMTARAAKEAVDNVINVEGVVDASSATMKGGKIILSGGDKGKVAVSGKLDASGTDGGEIDVTGQNINLAEASKLKADGGQGADGVGEGGDIVAFADNAALYHGEISAVGGEDGGEGGFVETSAKGYLEITGDVDAGEWLIDPASLEIKQVASNSGISGTNPFAPDGSLTTSVLDIDALLAALALADVTVQTIDGVGSGTGDIIVNANIDNTANATSLALESWNDIFLNSWIESGTGDVSLKAGYDVLSGTFRASDSHIYANNRIDTDGGSINLEATGDIRLTSRLRVQSGDGDIMVSAGRDILGGSFAKPVPNSNQDVTTTNGTIEFDAGRDIKLGGANGKRVNVSGGGDVTLAALGNIELDGEDSGFVRVRSNTGDVTLKATAGDVDIRGGDAGDSFSEVVATLGSVGIEAGGNVTIDSGASAQGQARIQAGSTKVGMADISITAVDVTIDGGTVNPEITATNGGDIEIAGSGVFASTADTLKTSGTGSIAVNQNAGGLIQDAIDAIDNAGTGANTVNVGAGTFTENLTIDKSLDLLGSGTGSTTVSGLDTSDHTIGVTGQFGQIDGVKIADMTINAPEADEKAAVLFFSGGVGNPAKNVDNVVLSNLVIQGNSSYDAFGFGLNENENVSIQNVEFKDLGIGIEAGGIQGDFTVERSSFANVDTGLRYYSWTGYIENTADPVLINNDFSDFGGGDFAVQIGRGDIDAHASFAGLGVNAVGNWWGVTSGADIEGTRIDLVAALNGVGPAAADFSTYLLNGTNNAAGTGFDGDFSELGVTAEGDSLNGGRIQTAVNLIDDGAKTGGDRLVKVEAGTFSENVLVNKSVTLLGAQANVDARGRTGVPESKVGKAGDHGFTVTADDVTINGFEVTGGKRGIAVAGTKADAVTGATIVNNIVSSTSEHGIHGAYADDIMVSQNAVSSTGLGGISIGDTDNAQILANNVDGAGAAGIALRVTNSDASGNVVTNTHGHGIWIDQSDDVTLSGNTVDTTGVSKVGDGVYAADTKNLSISSGSIENAGRHGIYLENTGEVSVQGLTQIGSAEHGILFATDLSGDDYAVITGNTITAGKDGIRFEGDLSNDYTGAGPITDDIYISLNSITGGQHGIAFTGNLSGDSHEIAITGNTLIKGKGGDGVRLDGDVAGAKLSITDNTSIIGSENGVYIRGDLKRLTGAGKKGRVYVNGSEGSLQSVEGVAGDGIYIEDTTLAGFDIDIAAKWNYVTADKDGIEFKGIRLGLIKKNTIDGTGANGIYVNGSPNTWVNGNTVDNTGAHGILVNPSPNAGVVLNKVGLNGPVNGDGIRIVSSNGAKVRGNEVQNTVRVTQPGDASTDLGAGIRVLNSEGVQVGGSKSWMRNTISKTGWDGIAIVGSTSTNVENNDISSVAGDGIRAWYNDGLTVVDNDVERETRSNFSGLSLGNFAGTVSVTGNEFTGFGYGIWGVSSDVTIKGNTIENPGRDGIYLFGGSNFTIGGAAANEENFISGTGEHGIHLSSLGGMKLVQNNVVYNTIMDGIRVNGSTDVDILDNYIGYSDASLTQVGDDNIGGVGINVYNGSNNVDIKRNEIIHTAGAGVRYDGSGLGFIKENVVRQTNGNGIEVTNATSAVNIVKNDVYGAGVDGIYAEGARGFWINQNHVEDAGEDGIHVDNSLGTNYSNDTDIVKNTVTGSDEKGIHVTNSTFVTVGDDTDPNAVNTVEGGEYGIYVDWSDDVLVGHNTVKESGTSGIEFRSSQRGDVRYNSVYSADSFGIRFAWNSDNGSITFNDVDGDSDTGTGIKVEKGSDYFDIDDNTVYGTTGRGIWAKRNIDSVSRNIVYDTGDDAIEITDSNGVDVKENWVGYSSTNFVDFEDAGNVGGEGIDIDNSPNAEVMNNKVAGTVSNGISLNPSHGSVIQGNDLASIGMHGIFVFGSDGVRVEDNTVRDFGKNGIYGEASDSLTITGNTILGWPQGDLFGLNGENGIVVEGDGEDLASHATVEDNVVLAMEDSGIVFEYTDQSGIRDNIVIGTGDHGIAVFNSGQTVIENNLVALTGLDALFGFGFGGGEIELSNYDEGPKRKPRFFFNEGNGIHVEDSFDTQIVDNLVLGSVGHGINVTGGAFANITDNQVALTGGDGIRVDGEKRRRGRGFYPGPRVLRGENDRGESEGRFDFVNIEGNQVILTGENGIAVDGRGFTRVVDNDVFASGIGFYGLFSGDQDIIFDLDVEFDGGENQIRALREDDERGSLFDAIRIEGQAGFEWGDGHGITVTDVRGAMIEQDEPDNEDDNYVTASIAAPSRGPQLPLWAEALDMKEADVLIEGNSAKWTGGHGINVEETGTAIINDNDVVVTGVDKTVWNVDLEVPAFVLEGLFELAFEAYEYLDESDAETLGDDTRFIGGLAKDIIKSVNIADLYEIIPAPAITEQSTHDGIHVEGVEGLLIEHNKVKFAGRDGIRVENADLAFITDNQVRFSGRDAVGLDTIGHAEVTLNELHDSGDDGIDSDETTKPETLIVADNIVGNNGDNGIEVSNSVSTGILRNIVFNNSANGLYMEGPTNGGVVLSGNTFTNNETGARFESGLINFVAGDANTFVGGRDGMVFDLDPLAAPLDLQIDGNTIGETVFEGQSRFYVQLQNGALFQPGTPTVIDGLNASYDGFIPANSEFGPGILTLAQFNAIEAKIFDFIDDATLGLFFFGIVPTIDQEDIFRGIDPFAGLNAGPNLAVLSLPSVTADQAALLNAIAPAAGEDLTAEEAAAFEPAAGAPETRCFGEALNGAQQGQAYNVNFGNSQEEILNAGAACGADF